MVFGLDAQGVGAGDVWSRPFSIVILRQLRPAHRSPPVMSENCTRTSPQSTKNYDVVTTRIPLWNLATLGKPS